MNSHPLTPISNFIKKRGKIHEGGLGQNPQRNKKNSKKQTKRRRNKRTSTYGYLNRGKPRQSALVF